MFFMQSDGGLSPLNSFSGSKAILSGPAGGVVGYALTTPLLTASSPEEGEKTKETAVEESKGENAGEAERRRAIIGFDMGGTSTDVSRFEGAAEGEQSYDCLLYTSDAADE